MFIKIFFGKIDPTKISENGTNISFWSSDKYFSLLTTPIDSEHGVFQYFCEENDYESFWWTFDGNFTKSSQEDFIQIISRSINKFEENSFLAELFDFLCISLADLFDIEDKYGEFSYCVDDTNVLDVSQYSNYDEKKDKLWVFEVTRYENPSVNINGNDFNLMCENNEDELNMKFRLMFCLENK